MKIYKITIEEINRIEKNKTQEMFFHITDKEKNGLTWFEHHKLSNEEQQNFYATEIQTQEIEIKETTQKIYEQEIVNLDIGELAIYINRAK